MTEDVPPRSATHIAVREAETDRVVELPALLRQLGAAVAIRMQEEDFSQLHAVGPLLTHFNLGSSVISPGTRCVLLPIVCAGSRDQQAVEVLPVVDPARARLATCIETMPGLAIEAVTAAQFATSLPGIRCTAALKAALLRRYRPQRPGRSDQYILGQGCTVTLLRLDPAADMSVRG